MPKHWKMQALIRDRKTGRITGHQRPRTFPPDIAQRMLKSAPNDWEVLDDHFEVEPDVRGNVPKSTMVEADAPKPVATGRR